MALCLELVRQMTGWYESQMLQSNTSFQTEHGIMAHGYVP